MTTPVPTAPTTPAPDWSTPRWHGIQRDYTVADVLRLRGSVVVDHTLAKLGAAKLWHYLQTTPYVASLGALSGNQAMQMGGRVFGILGGGTIAPTKPTSNSSSGKP